MTRYVNERRDAFGVEPVCRVLEVPVSTYYARRSRKPSRRELRDRELVAEIHAAREGYRRVYGVRKTWKELRRRGVDVGRDHVARLMRTQGLEGLRRGKKKRTTIPDQAALERARDLLQRDFTATRPNEKWVADVTYLRTWHGFCYLAFILDCFSRMIVGWQLATHMRTDLVMDALEMANGLRRPSEELIVQLGSGLVGCGPSLLCNVEDLTPVAIAPVQRGRPYPCCTAVARDRRPALGNEAHSGRRARAVRERATPARSRARAAARRIEALLSLA